MNNVELKRHYEHVREVRWWAITFGAHEMARQLEELSKELDAQRRRQETTDEAIEEISSQWEYVLKKLASK